MTEENKRLLEEKNTGILQQIARKTEAYKAPSKAAILFSVAMEILCYLLCLFFLTGAYYLPGYLELKLEGVEEEIGFYILDMEERPFWIFTIRTTLIVLGILPLAVAILLRRLRRRGRVLREVFGIAREEVL